ncbi:MAG: hypothetical protein GY832_36570 [Chloroflexi bacterium]|nr:hypothetical protein [Chloroflexota bacterium]
MDNSIIDPHAGNGNHPIQTRPPYHCPHCQNPVPRVLEYNAYRNPHAAWKPLDDLGEHLVYLHCEPCNTAHRAARLGFVILPFDWPPTVDAQGEARTLTAALAEIARLTDPQPGDDTGIDPFAAIIYRTLAGTITPQAAILEIRQLVEVIA